MIHWVSRLVVSASSGLLVLALSTATAGIAWVARLLRMVLAVVRLVRTKGETWDYSMH
jgi:hypothetical protein